MAPPPGGFYGSTLGFFLLRDTQGRCCAIWSHSWGFYGQNPGGFYGSILGATMVTRLGAENKDQEKHVSYEAVSNPTRPLSQNLSDTWGGTKMTPGVTLGMTMGSPWNANQIQ